MKITTGMAGGRTIEVPKGALRPTQDKVRQALFSSLGEAVAGARVLDLFAGSGAVGFEAWSRGAEFVCFVEQDARAAEVIRRNAVAFGLPKDVYQIIKADVAAVLARPLFPEPFTLIFADPPYRRTLFRRDKAAGGLPKAETGKQTREAAPADGSWQETVLNGVAAGPILSRNGLLIFEQGDDEAVCQGTSWRVIRERSYGAAKLVYYSFSDV